MSSGDVAGESGEIGESESRSGTREEAPAVGVVLSNGNDDAVTRVVLRAIERDYPVVLTYRNDPSPKILASFGELNVTVTAPSGRDDTVGLVSNLYNEAQKEGYPGLIYHENPSKYIDYERTSRRFSGSTSLVRPVTTTTEPPSAQRPDVLVAIPAYNEADTVGDVVSGALPHADEVLVVDDGSDDDTPTVASQAGATVVRHRTNTGYGSTLRTVFQEAKQRDANRLVVLDADGQHDPNDIPRLVEAQRTGQRDIVIGNRFASGVNTQVPAYRRLGLGVVNILTNLSLVGLNRDDWVRDTQSGFRVYSRRAVRSLATDHQIGEGMGASTDILYHATRRDYAVEEVGTEIDYGVEGSSSHPPVSHGLALVRNILARVEARRPVTLFGGPGLVATLCGLAAGVSVLASYAETGSVAVFPAVAASALVFVGSVACLTSVLLHSVNVALRRPELTGTGASDE